MRKLIARVIGENIEEFRGARVDKSDKEIFHTFDAYRKMQKVLADINVNITDFSREELDEIGHILTINTEKEAILNAFRDTSIFENSLIEITDTVRDCLIEFRKNNTSLFGKWHSFSLKIMNELIPIMYEQPKEQMTLLTEMGVFKDKAAEFIGLKYIPVDAASEEIYNPVVRRSVRISFKILNEILKKYGGV